MKKEEYFLKLNRAIDFVENNINNKIELHALSEYAFSSLSHFHRIFFFMTGFTLKDYIRQRRLSNAAIQLLKTNKSIIDIAHEIQFETPESFNKAFKKMYQLSPSEFRKQKPEFPVMRKLELEESESIRKPDNISLNFVFLAEQKVIGFKTNTTLENKQQTIDIPNFFAAVMKNELLKTISNVIDRQKIFGIYSNMTDEETFDYTVGLLVDKNLKQPDNLSIHVLPEAEYARFTVSGGPQELESAWRYIYGHWMPTSGRSRQKGFDFEIYYPDKTDIYIPMTPQD